jgi:hypothetical protein
MGTYEAEKSLASLEFVVSSDALRRGCVAGDIREASGTAMTLVTNPACPLRINPELATRRRTESIHIIFQFVGKEIITFT